MAHDQGSVIRDELFYAAVEPEVDLDLVSDIYPCEGNWALGGSY